ncbi:MAG: hypothetical protein MUE59_10530 [Thiobacillaceae bacterium]|nr:hypothetical protein [Thiobacillaceae bacterium]
MSAKDAKEREKKPLTAKDAKEREGKTSIREWREQARIKAALSLVLIRVIRG